MALNHYRLLGVPPDAGQRRIKSAYRSLAKRFHPDQNNGSETAAELFRQVNHAYKVLSSPQLRQQYDQKLAQQEKSATKPGTAHIDPQQKFNRFINSLLDALFGKIDATPQTAKKKSPATRKFSKKREKPAFNFHYNIAVENGKSPYIRGKDGVFRKAPKQN